MPDTYSGIVSTIGDPELGKNGKERPRKIVLKQDLSEQYGKTFRLFAWKDDFQKLRMGERVTVDFVAQPHPTDPTKNGSNEIVAVYVDSEDGTGFDSSVDSGGFSSPVAAGTPAPSSDNSWGMPPDEWSQPQAGAQRIATKQMSKEDYWERKEARDKDTTREIEAAWGITNAIALLGTAASDPNTGQIAVHEVAHQLIVMKHRIASELGQ